MGFRGQTTRLLPPTATPELVKFALEELSTVNSVAVNFVSGTTMCTAAGETARIQFTDIPMASFASTGVRDERAPRVSIEEITVTNHLSTTGATASVAVFSGGFASALNSDTVSHASTEPAFECNRRGSCDRSTGVCECFEGFSSSGDGDCGIWNGTQLHTCPKFSGSWLGGSHGECSNVRGMSGNYTCDTGNMVCDCPLGYTGWACEHYECPSGKAWFDEANDKGAHLNGTECSNAGICDRSTGTCSCNHYAGLFGGIVALQRCALAAVHRGINVPSSY